MWIIYQVIPVKNIADTIDTMALSFTEDMESDFPRAVYEPSSTLWNIHTNLVNRHLTTAPIYISTSDWGAPSLAVHFPLLQNAPRPLTKEAGRYAFFLHRT